MGFRRTSDREVAPIPKDCATSGYKRVIHDPYVWRELQDAYMDSARPSNAETYRSRWVMEPSYSGFNVEVVVKDHGHRGRSVYAAEPIAKGTKVWETTHLVPFYTPYELRSFLAKLDHDLQCDALLWAYVEKGYGYVSLALDPASFVNHGETDDVINLDKDNVARWDIDVGEELLENYTYFIGFDEKEVEWFHRIRGIAWKEGKRMRSRSTGEYNLLGAPKMWGILNSEYEQELVLSPTVWQPLLALTIFGLIIAIMRKILPAHFLRKVFKRGKNSRMEQ